MDTLTSLTETAQRAVSAFETLERRSTEEKREQVLIYGRALAAIRKHMPNTQAFGQHLAAHQLDVRNNKFRSDAMWLAEHEAEFLKSGTLCPHANPSDIRTWLRRQDPNYQPKKGSTRAGRSKATIDVRDFIRAAVLRGEPINVQEVVKATGRSRIVVEAAIAAERGRLEGLTEQTTVDYQELAEAMGLSETAKAKLASMERRLAADYARRFQDELTGQLHKHIKEYVLPEYNRLLTVADERINSYKPPLTFAEYNTLIWALHEDQTDATRRADAFALIHRLRVVLRGAEKEEAKPRSLPSTLAELMARRKGKRAA